MAPRPWRSKPSPRVDPTRANGEHEACARAPDGAGGGGRAYRRAYRRMKGTRAGALWTHSDACVGRSPHNIHDPGCITGSAVSSARRMSFGGVVYVKCSGARTERNLLTGRRTLEERCVATPHARRPQAPAHGAPNSDARPDAPARHRSRKYEVEYEGRGGCGPGGTQRGARAGGTRAPGVDPGDARAKRAPAARGSSGLGTLQARLHAPAGPRVSRHSCPDVVSAPTRAARSAAAEPIRTQAPGRTAPPAAAGAGAAAGGGEKRCRVERAPDPRRSRSSGRHGCAYAHGLHEKIHAAAAAARPRRGRSVRCAPRPWAWS